MANLEEKEKWETGIYQIEESDPVHGGADGVTNKPIKQLANRTKYLKKEVERRYVERSATTAQTGTVQLNSSDNSESETEAATPKVVKKLKGLIDALTRNLGNYIPNSKKSNSVTSPSADTVATSAAAKTAYDKAVEALNKANSKQSPAATLAGYGITDFSVRSLTASDNLNDITVKGIYNNTTYRNTTDNNYPEKVAGVLLVLSNAEQVYFAANGRIYKRYKSNNNWADGWVRLDNLTTPIGDDQNLDEITTDGNYYIVGTSKATLAKNYPVERGDGALEVFGNGYFQRFTTFHSRQVFNRRKVGGNWTNWVMSADDKSEIRQKTIDYTKAEGYAYSGFYRPNGDKLNNLPLASLMMHITHPSYTTNAHARGIGFSYGSYNGNQAWDIFTTAFDANGTYLGQKQIMTELGGIFRGDINLNNNMLGFSADTTHFINSKNIDGIWHDDNSNTFHFQSDSTYKKTGDAGNASLSAVNYFASGRVEIKSNAWGRIRAILPDGGYWQWEVNPASATDPRFNYIYCSASGEQRYLAFPQLTKNEVVAYRGWVDEKIQSLITYQKIGNFEVRKYPDGTMIQTYVINQNDLYEWFEKSFNWAIAFVDTPLIFSKVTTSIRGSHNAGVNILTKSNNATCYYHEYEHGGHNQGDVRIQFLAIGRWK